MRPSVYKMPVLWRKNGFGGLTMYKVFYNAALLMWGLLFAGCAYCAALMYLMTAGIMSMLWGIACVFWLGLLGWYVIDCVIFSKRRKRRKTSCRVEKRGEALRMR